MLRYSIFKFRVAQKAPNTSKINEKKIRKNLFTAPLSFISLIKLVLMSLLTEKDSHPIFKIKYANYVTEELINYSCWSPECQIHFHQWTSCENNVPRLVFNTTSLVSATELQVWSWSFLFSCWIFSILKVSVSSWSVLQDHIFITVSLHSLSLESGQTYSFNIWQ